jgi:hypothetical protein
VGGRLGSPTTIRPNPGHVNLADPAAAATAQALYSLSGARSARRSILPPTTWSVMTTLISYAQCHAGCTASSRTEILAGVSRRATTFSQSASLLRRNNVGLPPECAALSPGSPHPEDRLAGRSGTDDADLINPGRRGATCR